LPPKPNNIKSISDLYRANVFQNSLTGKQHLQGEDGSKLCFQISLAEVLGFVQETTTLSANQKWFGFESSISHPMLEEWSNSLG
jgi:hypothetical protein